MPVPPALPARSPLRPRRPTLVVDDNTMPPVDRHKPLPDPHRDASPPPLTKRQHALHELLSSERAYASDLALVREVHIPLALGQPTSFAVSTPNSSGSSSARSSTTDVGVAMTLDDVKLIFGNIADIAVFSELFCEALEDALGELLEEGKGDDHVGSLFLSIIPELERLYKQYITRHPSALTHLQELPQTAAVQNYLARTQAIASSLSHAWDLSSLLIKPVQRLLKYPLLLAAIIDETPDTHPDKANLREARKQMEEAARNVNEGRRRAEVVRDVLSSAAKKKHVVSVTKLKSLRAPPAKAHEDAVLVEHLQNQLYDIDEFARKFAKDVVEWVAATIHVTRLFHTWAIGFANVLGLTEEQPSEAFNAFLNVIENHLMAICADLDAVINERFLKELTVLLSTMTTPMKLLHSMNEQAPYHYHLLNVNISSKNRPPPSLLAASTNYLALRGQLAAELPTYVTLLHRGLLVFVQRLTTIQTEFWSKVRNQWLLLWEMLRLEEELNVTAEETSNVWFARWIEIDEMVSLLPIMQTPAPEYASQDHRYSQNPPPSYTSNSPPASTSHSSIVPDSPHAPSIDSFFASSLSGGYFGGVDGMAYEHAERVAAGATDRGRHKEHDKDKKKKSAAQARNAISALSALESSAFISSPTPLSPRSGTSSDLSSGGGKKSITKRESSESLSSKATAKSPKHQPNSPKQLHQPLNQYRGSRPYQQHLAKYGRIPRTKSMPLPYHPESSAANSAAVRNSGGRERSLSHRRRSGGKEKDDGKKRLSENSTRSNTSRGESIERSKKDKEKPSSRARSGSIKSITSFFTSNNNHHKRDSHGDPGIPNHNTPQPRDSWALKPAKYMCQVVHPCKPPMTGSTPLSYFSFPFFTLRDEELYDVLQEAGHPSLHPNLPLKVEEGEEDCLLLCRAYDGSVGWALASFLEPI
ncbi:hypothetical protein AGABI2DRAFT_185603 [Agaricus bisporus var. bisporus H97]|uniref:hypothetical protein n=1 Tax=Agaricus bisporus var. bisporus (strain H97 / ATCC MYA-4626 / FGSC 10389) TaxID=936046 RepID=UPI00029F7345|nr:hypothetical protein AGABI2DRAFT_185603 [Agaricus bisporus var. bisporus H97]EKV47676.1 hypothetical protein AGABI2DRAFT_185603 [Agaricus bisporus var. bisporus H97]